MKDAKSRESLIQGIVALGNRNFMAWSNGSGRVGAIGPPDAG